MLSNPALRGEISALVTAKDWPALRAWFRVYHGPEDRLDRFFLFAHLFLSHHFRDPSPLFHRTLARAYFSDRNEYMAAPRGFCRAVGSVVRMADGRSLPIEAVTRGDDVLVLDGLNLRKGRVLQTMQTGQKECIRLKTRSGRTEVCTAEHRVLSWGGEKEAGEIVLGERIASTRRETRFDSSKKRNADEIGLIAHLLMEGGLTRSTPRYTNTDDEVIADCRKRAVGMGFGFHRVSDTISFNITGATRWVEKVGLRGSALTKRVPDFVFSAHEDDLWLFLGICIATDGYVAKHIGKVGIGLANEGLIDDISRISRSLGLLPIKRHYDNGHAGCWTLEFGDESVRRILARAPLFHKEREARRILSKQRYSLIDTYPWDVRLAVRNIDRQARAAGVRCDTRYDMTRGKMRRLMNKFPKVRRWEELESADVFWDEVVAIEKVGVVDTYDIEVEGDGFYVGDGIITHNSKTTLFQAGLLFDCVCGLETFVAVVEKTFTEASEVIGSVREECVDNELLIAVYGDLLANERSRVKGRKSKSPDAEGDVIINGVRLRAKGFDQPIRGLKSREHRPSKIVCDDIEQDSHINSPEQRKKYEGNYNKGIQPAVDRDGRIKVFGTILHEDSLLSNLVRTHGGTVYRAYYLPSDAEWDEVEAITTGIVVDGVGPVRLLWASRWNYETLMRKRSDMMSSGHSSHAFEQEYRNYPLAEDDRKFKWEWLHDPERVISLDEWKRMRGVRAGYAAIDVADSTREGSDFTACVVHFVDADGNRYRVDVRNERRNVNGLIDLIFDVWEKWNRYGLVKIGVEKKAFEDQVRPLLRERSAVRQVFPVVEELRPMGRTKENRILGNLQGRYEQGVIWTVTDGKGTPVGDTETLLGQLHNFPASKKDDCSDAEAYCVEMSVIPLKDQNDTREHRDPVEDPFETPRQYVFSKKNMDEDFGHMGDHELDTDPYA